jgi:ceramide glucosyltransferase
LDVLGLLLFLLALLSTGYAVYAAYCTWAFFQDSDSMEAGDAHLPPVSVIKPVAGMEASTEEDYRQNFESFCLQDYPLFELLFALPPENDALIHLLEELKIRFPRVDVDWVLADSNKGPNYKVGNLVAAVKRAKHPVLVMSDSDMRVNPQYLRQTVASFLRQGTGLVTALYRNVHLAGLCAGLQALTVQTVFVPNVLFSRRVEGMSYAFGATLCTGRDILAGLGGMETFLDYLADDFQMGRRIHDKGYEIRLSRALVDQVSQTRTFRQYFYQQLRAAVTQKVCRPLGYIGSVLTHQVSLALLVLVVEKFSPAAWVLFVTVCAVRILSAGLLNRTTIHNRELSRYLWFIPFNDLLNTLIWLLSLFTDTVRWKERRFRVLKGGKMVELPGSYSGQVR